MQASHLISTTLSASTLCFDQPPVSWVLELMVVRCFVGFPHVLVFCFVLLRIRSLSLRFYRRCEDKILVIGDQ